MKKYEDNKIYFSVPGLAGSKILLFCLLEKKNLIRNAYMFNSDTIIESISGNFDNSWAGGDAIFFDRNLSFSDVVYEPDVSNDKALTSNLQKVTFFAPSRVKELFRVCDINNIAVRLNCSNPLIRDIDLDDQICNAMLSYIDTIDMNTEFGVSVSSLTLYNYLKEKYNKYYLVWDESLCETSIDKINELSKNNIVTVDTSFNNDFEKLKKFKYPNNIELIADSPCDPNCPFKKYHYTYNSLFKKGFDLLEIRTCLYNQLTVQDRLKYSDYENSINFFNYDMVNPSFISIDDIRNKYLPMGFNKFKISEHNYPYGHLMEVYLHYFVCPECRDDMRLHLQRFFWRSPSN